MTKCFLDDEIDQSLMMPPSLHDWLPEDHLARFVADLVPSLDLSEFYASYEEKDGRGQAAYHPVMMVRLLIYGYCIGVVSSRQIEKRTYEDVAFRYLSADEHPDHTTINEFRKRHLKALAGLFLQALQLCQSAGMVKMGHVALDGTKKQANASKHKAMSYGRMGEAEEKLKAQIQELLGRLSIKLCLRSCQASRSKRVSKMALSWSRASWTRPLTLYQRPFSNEVIVNPSFIFRVSSDWK